MDDWLWDEVFLEAVEISFLKYHKLCLCRNSRIVRAASAPTGTRPSEPLESQAD